MRFLRLYLALIKANWSMFTAYRWNILSYGVSSLGWTALSIITIVLAVGKTEFVYGWSPDQLILITCSYNIINGLFGLIFRKNFHDLVRMMNLGTFDQILLKPVDAQFLISVQYINFISLIRIIAGIILTVYVAYFHMDLSVSIFTIGLYLIYLVLAVLALYSFWLLLCTLLFWLPRLSNIIDLLNNLLGATKYPPDIYSQSGNPLLYLLVPFAFAVVVPAKILLQILSIPDAFIATVLIVGLLFLSRAFWLFALRSYTSASS